MKTACDHGDRLHICIRTSHCDNQILPYTEDGGFFFPFCSPLLKVFSGTVKVAVSHEDVLAESSHSSSGSLVKSNAQKGRFTTLFLILSHSSLSHFPQTFIL